MKTCEDIQRQLRDRFDMGEPIADFAEDHAGDCEDCFAYRAELTALASEMVYFEPEPVPGDLAARIAVHVRKHGADGGLQLRDYIALGALSIAALSAWGWYGPSSFGMSAAWADPQTWLAQWNALFQTQAASGWLSNVQSAMNDAQSSMPSIPQTILWPALALSCTCAVAFNAFFALRMRTAGD